MCLLALEQEVLWAYPVGTWAQLRDIARRGQPDSAQPVPGDEQSSREQLLRLRLSALTPGQLDQAKPYDSGWNGREIVLLAEEERLGLSHGRKLRRAGAVSRSL